MIPAALLVIVLVGVIVIQAIWQITTIAALKRDLARLSAAYDAHARNNDLHFPRN
jgi:hypothetical protein